MLSHADHKPERLNLSVKGRQKHRQKYTIRANVTWHCISMMPSAGITTQVGNGLEIQPSDYWGYDHLKPDLALQKANLLVYSHRINLVFVPI